jgi:hypothetical protein
LAAGGLPPATGPIHACFNRRGGCRCVRDGCAAAQERVDVFTPLFPIDPFDDYGFPVERSPNDFEALWCQLYELGPHRVKIGFAIGGDEDGATAQAADLLHPLAERLIRFLCGTPKRALSQIVEYPVPVVTHRTWSMTVLIDPSDGLRALLLGEEA